MISITRKKKENIHDNDRTSEIIKDVTKEIGLEIDEELDIMIGSSKQCIFVLSKNISKFDKLDDFIKKHEFLSRIQKH